MGYGALFLSFLLHLTLIGSVVFFQKKLPREKPKEKKQHKKIREAIRVDVVSMPKLTLKELKVRKKTGGKIAPIAPGKKVEKKKRLKVEEKPIPSGQKKFSHFLKKLSNVELQKVRVQKKEQKALNQKEQEALEGLIVEGNKLSKGSQLLGKGKDSLEIQQGLEVYIGNVVSAVRTYWSLPSYLLGKNLTCQLRVYISENGDLLKTQVYKKSGVEEFDQRAILAIEKASPFGVPSALIVEKLVEGEVLLGFPL